ncbi:hypothetical protein Pse7367_1547 [Thalassoporum mexicanum PCC 7367]|uniref:hypothetical protein n=1 Tax=Thalassoporum mexicanum TaxID=3457544 RepID=UPI00029F9CA7|nr:hypothetical protein [Pseudanabaena sp. PCC 7367]AFY69836.1 hypothetical protein Pse7367_1547 [Pseudanabaena sp. PCC 7367]
MFAQFRAQYPQGSIQTEMLSKVDGMHVFRATIGHGEVVLATATATDPDIEVAEDRAIRRALTIAGINFDRGYGMQATLMPQPQHALNGSTVNSFTDAQDAEHEPLAGAVNSAALAGQQQLNLAGSVAQTNKSNNVADYEDEYEPEPQPKPKSRKKAKNYQPESEPEPTPPIEPEISTEPIDLSDPIAQTDVELERLGWGKEEGRKYLQQAFSKRSRHQLTKSEMLEFLNHLKAQPTPQDF